MQRAGGSGVYWSLSPAALVPAVDGKFCRRPGIINLAAAGTMGVAFGRGMLTAGTFALYSCRLGSKSSAT